MRITIENIGSYIQYLYQRKYSTAAPQELVERWKSVPNDQIDTQLKALYQHWSMTDQEVVDMLNGFSLQQGFVPNPTPSRPSEYEAPPVNTYQNPYKEQPYYSNPAPQQIPSNNGNVWKIIAAILAIAIAGVGIFYFLNRNNTTSTGPNDGSILRNNVADETPAKTIPDQVATKPLETPKSDTSATVSDVRAPNLESTEKEIQTRTQVIKNLLSNEVDRDLNGILDKFAKNPQQYWDMKNPTSLQIRDAYMRTWSKVDDIQYKNINVKRVSKNVYDLYADYSFYSLKDDSYKKKSVQTRYEFNDNGEIIKTYGIAQN